MDVYVGIDGTGTGNGARYAELFRNSFVSRLAREENWAIARYWRGPTADGRMTREISRSAHGWLEQGLHKTRGQAPRLFIAGYSRGGAAAIRVCRELGAHGHPVHCLLLFDAVDMTHTVEASLVPRNVRYCFHARRHPAAASRTFWGNCGTRPESADRNVTWYQEQFFRCTHGGMGGVPWNEEDADEDGIINEALTDRAQTQGLRRLMTSPGALPVVVGNEIHRRASRTTIHWKQDQDVSRKVGAVMVSCLAGARRARTNPAPAQARALVG